MSQKPPITLSAAVFKDRATVNDEQRQAFFESVRDIHEQKKVMASQAKSDGAREHVMRLTTMSNKKSKDLFGRVRGQCEFCLHCEVYTALRFPFASPNLPPTACATCHCASASHKPHSSRHSISDDSMLTPSAAWPRDVVDSLVHTTLVDSSIYFPATLAIFNASLLNEQDEEDLYSWIQSEGFVILSQQRMQLTQKQTNLLHQFRSLSPFVSNYGGRIQQATDFQTRLELFTGKRLPSYENVLALCLSKPNAANSFLQLAVHRFVDDLVDLLYFVSGSTFEALWDLQLIFPNLFLLHKTCLIIPPFVSSKTKPFIEDTLLWNGFYIAEQRESQIDNEPFIKSLPNQNVSSIVDGGLKASDWSVGSYLKNNVFLMVAASKVASLHLEDWSGFGVAAWGPSSEEEGNTRLQMLFPTVTKYQRTLLILRPFIVRGQLADVIVNIFKLNGFHILKRRKHRLSEAELFQLLDIPYTTVPVATSAHAEKATVPEDSNGRSDIVTDKDRALSDKTKDTNRAPLKGPVAKSDLRQAGSDLKQFMLSQKKKLAQDKDNTPSTVASKIESLSIHQLPAKIPTKPPIPVEVKPDSIPAKTVASTYHHHHDNALLDLMLEADCEILVLGKDGAVHDCKALTDAPFSSAASFSLQRLQSSSVPSGSALPTGLSHTDPFHASTHDHFKGESGTTNSTPIAAGHLRPFAGLNGLIDPRFAKKDMFPAGFNFVAHSSGNETIAGREISIFFPEMNSPSETILLVNPDALDRVYEIRNLLLWMDFDIIRNVYIFLNSEQIFHMFKKQFKHASILEEKLLHPESIAEPSTVSKGRERFPSRIKSSSQSLDVEIEDEYRSLKRLLDYWTSEKIAIFHIMKPGAFHEIQSIIGPCSIDRISSGEEISELPTLTLALLHHAVVACDSQSMFEDVLDLLFPVMTLCNAEDLNQESFGIVNEVLERCTLTTLGTHLREEDRVSLDTKRIAEKEKEMRKPTEKTAEEKDESRKARLYAELGLKYTSPTKQKGANNDISSDPVISNQGELGSFQAEINEGLAKERESAFDLVSEASQLTPIRTKSVSFPFPLDDHQPMERRPSISSQGTMDTALSRIDSTTDLRHDEIVFPTRQALVDSMVSGDSTQPFIMTIDRHTSLESLLRHTKIPLYEKLGMLDPNHISFRVQTQKFSTIAVRIRKQFRARSVASRKAVIDEYESMKYYYSKVRQLLPTAVPSEFQFRVLPNESTDLIRSSFIVESYLGPSILSRLVAQVVLETKSYQHTQSGSNNNTPSNRLYDSVSTGRPLREEYTEDGIHSRKIRGSLHAFYWGKRTGQMVQQLQTLKSSIQGAGLIQWNGMNLVCETTFRNQAQYLTSQSNKYHSMLQILNDSDISFDRRLVLDHLTMTLQTEAFAASRLITELRLVPWEVLPECLRISDESTVAICSVRCTLDSKFRLAANVLFLFDFYLRVVERQPLESSSSFIFSNQDDSKSVHVQYDKMLDGFRDGFLSGYEDKDLTLGGVCLLDMEYSLFLLEKSHSLHSVLQQLRERKYSTDRNGRRYDDELDIDSRIEQVIWEVGVTLRELERACLARREAKTFGEVIFQSQAPAQLLYVEQPFRNTFRASGEDMESAAIQQLMANAYRQKKEEIKKAETDRQTVTQLIPISPSKQRAHASPSVRFRNGY